MKRYQRSFVWASLLVVFSFIYFAFKFPSIQGQKVEILGKFVDRLAGWVPSILIVVIIFIFTNLAINISTHFITKYFEKKGKKEQDLFLVLIVYKYIVWFLAIMVSLSTLFKNFASLLTSIGLIGFGITFALQKPILNFVGWLSIIANGPYKIGDRIMINGMKGDVFNIKVMYTYLREVDNDDDMTGRVVTIPNEFVLSYGTTNFTRGSPYVWEEVSYSITYESNWKKAVKILEESADELLGEEMKKLAQEWGKVQRRFEAGTSVFDKPIIRLSLAESWIKLRIRYLIDVRKKKGINTKLNSIVLEKFGNAKDIKIAYPHMHVILDK